jgi:hypothetical protein
VWGITLEVAETLNEAVQKRSGSTQTQKTKTKQQEQKKLRSGSISVRCQLEHDALVLGLVPLDGLVLGHLVVEPHPAPGALPAGDAPAGPLEHDVKVHAVNAGGRVVLEPEVNVLRDAKAKVARLGKVAPAQLVLLDLEAALKELLGLGAAHGHVARNLLVTPDAAQCGFVFVFIVFFVSETQACNKKAKKKTM